MQDRHVVVVGDVMLDEYLLGSVRRVSPEAPVPVLELQGRTDTAGGAGNAAANIGRLGGRVQLGALVGEDDSGERLRTALKAAGVVFSGAVSEPDRRTTTKTRLVAGQQQIARVDVEDAAAMVSSSAERLFRWFEQACEDADAVLLCDYRKGVLSNDLCARLIAHSRAQGLPVVVDPKGVDYGRYLGATVITPNLQEAEAATRHIRPLPEGPESCAAALAAELDGTAILLTRGADGMTLLAPGQAPLTIPADVRQVFDVTGAGDTVAAVLALALAARADLAEATRMANRAAGLVVARFGTTALHAEDLRKAFEAGT